VVKSELRSVVAKASLLPVGGAFYDATAGVRAPWHGDLTAYLRAEAGWKPTDWLTAGGFVEANTREVMAGVGIKGTF
jgi:hypothetical protein